MSAGISRNGGESLDTCTTSRKFMFESRRKARAFIKSRKGKSLEFTARETYRCPDCGQWHIATPRRDGR